MTGTPMRINPDDQGDMPLFSTSEAEDHGISRRDLGVLVRRRRIWQVARGWYSSHTVAMEEDRHILRTVANLRLQSDPGTVACRRSAVLLHGLPLARTELTVVELAKATSLHGRTRHGLRISAIGPAEDRCTSIHVPLVDATVRVVDAASAIVGTAMTNNPLGALVAGDHALRHGVCTREQIIEALDARHGCAGIAVARLGLEHLEPRHESPGETLTAVVLRHLPWDFDPQVEVVARGRRYRLDFALREYRVAIEFDGAMKYTGPEVMEAQLRREADLRAEGWVIVRLTWEDLEDEGEIHARIAAAVREAAAAA